MFNLFVLAMLISCLISIDDLDLKRTVWRVVVGIQILITSVFQLTFMYVSSKDPGFINPRTYSEDNVKQFLEESK